MKLSDWLPRKGGLFSRWVAQTYRSQRSPKKPLPSSSTCTAASAQFPNTQGTVWTRLHLNHATAAQLTNVQTGLVVAETHSAKWGFFSPPASCISKSNQR